MPQGTEQRAHLRLVEKKASPRRLRPNQVSRVISFTSGKGGVGKTSVVVNLGIALADMGRSVLLLDADLGLANIDVMLGLQPKYTLLDLFEGRKRLEEIMVDGPHGISIIPAASGVESICNLRAEHKLLLMDAVENMACGFDYILIDTQAGIGSDVMYFNSAAGEIVCVINCEPTSLTDAYALIKVLSQNYGEKSISILANNIPGDAAKEAMAAYRRLDKAVQRFLHVELNYLGVVPADNAWLEAIKTQRALLELFPSSPSGLAIAALAKKLDSGFHEWRVKGGMQFFFRQLLDLSSLEER